MGTVLISDSSLSWRTFDCLFDGTAHFRLSREAKKSILVSHQLLNNIIDTGDQIWGSLASADMNLDGVIDFVVGSKDKPLKVVCKAIDMRDVDPTANNRLITELVQQVKNKGLFDYNETKPRELDETERMELADLRDDKSEEEGKARLKTYLFGLNLVLREPIEL